MEYKGFGSLLEATLVIGYPIGYPVEHEEEARARPARER
jgi:hypothetical protein